MNLIHISDATSPTARFRMSESLAPWYSGACIEALLISEAATPGFGVTVATTKGAFSGVRAWSPPV